MTLFGLPGKLVRSILTLTASLLAAVASLQRRPRLRHVSLTLLASPALVWVWSPWQQASPDSHLLPAHHFSAPGAPQLVMAYTDQGRAIPLHSYAPQPATREMLRDEDAWLVARGLAGKVTRTAPGCGWLVCHDWVFTGGRCSLPAGVVPVILEDNGYHKVNEPAKGDLAIYRHRVLGEIIHSAVVRDVQAGRVLVEGKWAWLGRYHHPAELYYHPEAVCSFYHSDRAGHVLRGVEQGTNPSTPAGELDTAPAGPRKPAAPSPSVKSGPRGSKRWAGGPATAPGHSNPALIQPFVFRGPAFAHRGVPRPHWGRPGWNVTRP
jgi:hypothetical protein